MLTGASAAAVRAGGGVSRPEGEPELPRVAGGAHLHRGPDRVRAAVLQRRSAEVRQQARDDPVEVHRRHVQLHPTRVLQGRRGRDRSPAGPVLSPSASPVPFSRGSRCTNRSPRTSARPFCSSRASCCCSSRSASRSTSCLNGGVVGIVDRRVDRDRFVGRVVLQQRQGRARDLARQAGRPAAVRPLLQPRRGPVHRERAPDAAALHHRRRRAQRVLDRPQPQALGGRRHDRPARRR